MVRCIVIDDEPKARILLQTLLAEYCPEVECVTACGDLNSGVEAIRKHEPDLVFLDIEMPGGSGLEIIEHFPKPNFGLIFTTAYSEYAIQAFRFSAIDYLLKPLQHLHLQEAVERFIQRQHHLNSMSLQHLHYNLLQTEQFEQKRISISTSTHVHFVYLKDIVLFKAESAYTDIYLKSGECIHSSKHLGYFESAIQDVQFFFRSHKSYIINIKEVKDYQKTDGGLIRMRNGLIAALSNEKLQAFLHFMLQ